MTCCFGSDTVVVNFASTSFSGHTARVRCEGMHLAIISSVYQLPKLIVVYIYLKTVELLASTLLRASNFSYDSSGLLTIFFKNAIGYARCKFVKSVR